jgi:tetratricopeptide (TPR) repeat protein
MNHYHYAWYLALFGRFEEAIEEHRKAKRLDPLTPLHSSWLGALYLVADSSRYPEAIAELESALRLSPDNPSTLFVLALAQATGGMHAEAISTMEHAATLAPPMRPALGFVYSLAGRDDLARHILTELATQRPTAWTAYWRFMLNSRLGNLDEAFEWLAYEPHHTWVPWVRVDPWVRPLIEHDPRFQQFLERAGLYR